MSYEFFYQRIFIFTLFMVLCYLGLTINRKQKTDFGWTAVIFSDQPLPENNISGIQTGTMDPYLIPMQWALTMEQSQSLEGEFRTNPLYFVTPSLELVLCS